MLILYCDRTSTALAQWSLSSGRNSTGYKEQGQNLYQVSWVLWAHWIAARQMWKFAIHQDNASIHLIVDMESTIPLSFMWFFSGYRKQRLISPAFRIHERNTEILIVVTTWISFDFTNSLNWFLLTYANFKLGFQSSTLMDLTTGQLGNGKK